MSLSCSSVWCSGEPVQRGSASATTIEPFVAYGDLSGFDMVPGASLVVEGGGGGEFSTRGGIEEVGLAQTSEQDVDMEGTGDDHR